MNEGKRITKVISEEISTVFAKWATGTIASANRPKMCWQGYSGIWDIWDSYNSDIVSNEGGVLTFLRECTVRVDYTIGCNQMNYYYGTQTTFHIKGEQVAALGGTYWNRQDQIATGSRTVTMSPGDNICLWGWLDADPDDWESYIKGIVSVTLQ